MFGRMELCDATTNPRNPETPVERSVGWLPRPPRRAGCRSFPKTFYGILAVLATPPLRSLCEPTENGKGKCNAAAAAAHPTTKGSVRI